MKGRHTDLSNFEGKWVGVGDCVLLFYLVKKKKEYVYPFGISYNRIL